MYLNLLWGLLSCYGGEEGSSGGADGGRRPEGQARRRKRRGKGEWRPSLCSITEDRVVVAERAVKKGGAATERKAAAETGKSGLDQAGRKSPGGSRARVHVRGHSDDYGGSVSMTMAIPPFSPTPFAF